MATGERQKEERKRRSKSARRAGGARVDVPLHHATIHPPPLHGSVGHHPESDLGGHAKPGRGRLRRRDAARRIGRLASSIVGLDDSVGRLLADLAASVAAGRRRGNGMAACSAAISRCLEEAGRESSDAARCTLAEGAAWAFAWSTRGRPAVGADARLLERVLAAADSASRMPAGGEGRAASFLIALGGLFPASAIARDAAVAGREALARDIVRCTDDAGGPATGPAAAFVSRVVGWTLARDAGCLSGQGIPWDDVTEGRWRDACVSALRLLGDGGVVPGRGRAEPIDTAPLLRALAESKEGTVRRSARAIVASARRPKGRFLHRDAVGEAATVGVLRSGWGRGALRILLDFGRPLHHLEIAAGDRLVIAGDWGWSVEADGTPLAPTAPWAVCCFESDRKASFLEIAAPLPGGLQAERQVVLLPDDGVVILTDSITDAGARLPAERRPSRLEYRSRLFMAGTNASPEVETRECLLRTAVGTWRVLPLALPEWRAASVDGGLDVDDGMLSVRLGGTGGRLSAPIWIDTDATRATRPLTWRQLTVADTRTNLRRHEAVGFRVQAGLEQWLLYRALDTPRNRTLLGCNVACEFLVGRIGRNGEVSRTLEIE